MEALRADLRQQFAASRDLREREQAGLTADWNSALAEFQQAAAAMNELCQRQFPCWESIDGDAWKPQRSPEAVTSLQFGRYRFEIAGEKEVAFDLPTVLSHPARPSLLLEVEGEEESAEEVDLVALSESKRAGP